MARKAPVTLGLLMAVLWTASALAYVGGPLDAAFDNTVLITTSSSQERIYFNRDGTFTARGQDGDTYGNWRIQGDEICTKVRGADESCGAIELGRQVGDKWQHTFNGETITVEIVQGR